MKYKTPGALEQAVKAAARNSNRDTNTAIAAFWRDRLLCRVFSTPTPTFILKGGQDMLAKIPNARETRDIDLLGTTSNLKAALEELKQLAAINLDDFIDYRFEHGRPTDTSQDYRQGYTVTFGVWLGGTVKRGTVSIDLVADEQPDVEYDMIESVSSLPIEGLEQHPYAIATPAMRIAEKVGATLQNYDGRPSSRVKDLADLVKSMLTEDVDADALTRHVHSELAVRQIGQIEGFKTPETWKTTYAVTYRKLAKESSLPNEYENVAAAERAVANWLQPIFDGTLSDSVWSATQQR